MRQTSIVAAIAAVVSVFSFAPIAHAVMLIDNSRGDVCRGSRLTISVPGTTLFNLNGTITVPAGVTVTHTGDDKIVSGSVTNSVSSPSGRYEQISGDRYQ